MNRHLVSRRARVAVWITSLIAAALMAGCGGGGGDQAVVVGNVFAAPVAVVNTQSSVFVDSFGGSVDSGSGFGDGDAGVDGTAGEGAPIVGGTVLIADTTGRTVTTLTGSDGYYRAKVTGFVPPLLVSVTKEDKSTRHSLSTATLKTKGFVTINISGLTDKIVSDVAIAAGRSSPSQLKPQDIAANAGVITTSINSLRTLLSTVITAAKLDVNTFNPLNVPFRTDKTGYDYVLDNTVIVSSPTGATQVSVSPTFVAPPVVTTPTVTLATLAGTYKGTISGGDTGTFTMTVNTSGNISGSGFSNLDQASFSITGLAKNDGSFTSSFGSTSAGATFSGTADQNGNMSGTWSNTSAGLSGTAQGTKQ